MCTVPATLDRQQSNSLVHFAVVSTPRSGNTSLRLLFAKAYALKQWAAPKRRGEAMDCAFSGDGVAEAIETNSMEVLWKTSCNQHSWRGQPDNWRKLLTATEAQKMAHAQRASFAELDYECNPDESLSDAQAGANWEQFRD